MQKFHKGDFVRIADDLGETMRNFASGKEAIVVGSYEDQFVGEQTETVSYTLYIQGQGEVSWYYEHNLTLVAENRTDLLEEWRAAADLEKKQKRDLDWIFANGNDVIDHPHGASIAALASCFGLTDLSGGSSEYFVYHSNALGTLTMARPFLEAGDKSGWLTHCKKLLREAE